MSKMITKDMIIADVLKVDVELAPFFFAIGMHCLGCPSASGETIEEACRVHNTDCGELVAKMNEFLAEKQQKG
jgi:hybrid cluster-associated redox disulfide protein